jgi:sulfur carrier protein ThiS
MRITLKLYASLGDYLPESARSSRTLPIELPAEASVESVIDRFGLPRKLCHIVLINGAFVPPEERAGRRFAEGDELAIWPPIAGG